MASKLHDAVYWIAPIWAQNEIVTAYGRKLVRERYGQPYREALAHFVAKDYGNLQADLDLQLSEVRRLVAHAKENSRFYREHLAGFEPSNIRSLADLARLPVVDKEMLRARIEDVYTLPVERGISLFTGGTTGKSLMVVYRPEDFQVRMAYLDAFKLRCGIDPFASRKATFSGRSFAKGLFQGNRKIFWRDNRAYNQRMYSTFDLKEENMPYYLRNLQLFQPEVLNGFVSALHQLGGYVLRNGIDPGFRPKAIFTTSETLLPHHREVIQEAFGAHVYDQYGSAEGATFVTECREGRLHYNVDTGVIEAMDFGHGPEMLITSFTTYGTPLIRYRIGDKVTFAEGTCTCGSSHPLVERIEGRKVDYLYSTERGKVSLSHLADVIKGLPNCVKEMQFVQEDLDAISVYVVVDESVYTESDNHKIVDAMEYRFGKGVRIDVRKVPSIPREASGKFSLIRNNVDPARLAAIG